MTKLIKNHDWKSIVAFLPMIVAFFYYFYLAKLIFNKFNDSVRSLNLGDEGVCAVVNQVIQVTEKTQVTQVQPSRSLRCPGLPG